MKTYLPRFITLNELGITGKIFQAGCLNAALGQPSSRVIEFAGSLCWVWLFAIARRRFCQSIFYNLVFVVFTLLSFTGSSNGQSIEKYAQKKKILVPIIKGEYIHVYIPKGDVFPGPDTKDLKSGEYYPSWQPNDHCFVKGLDNRWNAFGITRPAAKPGERVSHAGEYVSFHALSPGENFEHSFRDDAWKDTSKVLPPFQRPGEIASNHAPAIVKHDNFYKMIYGPVPFRLAISKDLFKWEPQGPLKINEKYGRDPSLTLWAGKYYLTYCSGNVVKTTTSIDLANWSEPVEIFKAEVVSYHCESPTLLRHNNIFYLFWCLWDTAIASNGNGERTFVYCSNNPLDFHNKPLITELCAHAPEIIQGEDSTRWYISSAQYPRRGINVARLIWK